LQGAPGAFEIALALDLANRRQHVRRLDLGNGHAPDAAVELGQEIFAPICRRRRPALFAVPPALRAILVGEGRKGVLRLNARAHLVALFFARGVFAKGDQRPRLVTPLAGVAQTDFGIGPDGQQLLAPVDPVFEPPELAAGGRDQKEHARTVRHL
jgi:hypothetical protein